jgi:hypothetical protein
MYLEQLFPKAQSLQKKTASHRMTGSPERKLLTANREKT